MYIATTLSQLRADLSVYRLARRVESLVIEVTSVCDHGKCLFCYKNCSPDHGTDMSVGLARSIAQVIREELGEVPEIWLAGGEPTCNPHLFEIIDIFGEVSPYVVLVTNGFHLGNTAYTRSLLAHSALKEIAVTVNSGHSYVHNILVSSPDLYDETPFNLATDGLIAVADIRHSDETISIKTAVNLNMSSDGYMGGFEHLLLHELPTMYGHVIDKVIFQITNLSVGRAKELPADHPLIGFVTPTLDTVNSYFTTAQRAIDLGVIREALLIDPLPQSILDQQPLIASHPMYQAGSTPCIDELGAFRADVVNN